MSLCCQDVTIPFLLHKGISTKETTMQADMEQGHEYQGHDEPPLTACSTAKNGNGKEPQHFRCYDKGNGNRRKNTGEAEYLLKMGSQLF